MKVDGRKSLVGHGNKGMTFGLEKLKTNAKLYRLFFFERPREKYTFNPQSPKTLAACFFYIYNVLKYVGVNLDPYIYPCTKLSLEVFLFSLSSFYSALPIQPFSES